MKDASILRRVSLTATHALTSHAEIAAGVAGGLPMWHSFGNDWPPIGLALLLPVTIDCYVVDALERRNGPDKLAALGILAVSVICGSAYVAHGREEMLKAAGIGVVLVLVLARLYANPKPSRADINAADIARTEQAAEHERRVRAEQDREAAAAHLRVQEAEHLARIEAERVQAEVEATALTIQAEADAEIRRSEAARATAHAEAERLRAASETDIALLNAQSAADIARIRAEAEAKASARTPKRTSTRGPADTEQDIDGRQGTDSGPSDEDTHVIPFTGQKGRLVSAVLAGRMTQVEAAGKANVSAKTIQRWVDTARKGERTEVAG